MKKNMKKHVILTVCLLLVVCVASIGGTIAWLTDKTEAVENTFTASTIDIELDEENPTNKTAKMVPGSTITKDPKVTVKEGSEACWLFVKIEESVNFDAFMTYTVGTNVDGTSWTALDGYSGVYYINQPATTTDVTYGILAGDQVVVRDTVTKTMMDAIINGEATKPTLSFIAAAVQSENITTVDAAFAQVKNDLGITDPAPIEP